MVSFSFDDSKLKELQQNIKNVTGRREVPVTDLLTDNFIRQHSDFQSLQAMFDASSIKTLDEVGSEKFDTFISIHTEFRSWNEMIRVANADSIKRKLNP